MRKEGSEEMRKEGNEQVSIRVHLSYVLLLVHVHVLAYLPLR